jgi:type I restriction enzyme S subunit
MIERYKETPLGKLPIDWEVVKLSKICDVRDGTHDSPKYVEDGIPFVTSKNLTDTVLSFDNIKYISNDDHCNFSKRSHVENGDILFGMIGTVGKPIVVEEKFEFSIKNVALLKFSDNKILNNIFAKNILKSSLVLNQFKKISNGGVLNFVALGNIRSLDFPLPPLPEQQKIAEILSTVDVKIEVIDLQITQTQELKKGLMQRLLTKGIGHTEFKDSPLGKIPKSWEVEELQSLLNSGKNITYGIVQPGEYVEDGIYLIRSQDYTKGYWNPINTIMKVSKEIDKPYERSRVKYGDILITVVGANVGRIAVVTNELDGANISRSVARISIKKELANSLFIKYYLASNGIKNLIKLNQVGGAQPVLNLKELSKIKMPLPSKNEQQKIADILCAVDEKLEVLLEKKVNYQELKQGLMQQLLTGKVRVKA